jgi:SAM-dependent methyltransferase
MILWSNLEYVTLRLIRRFLFTGEALDRLGGLIPYWRVNQGRLDPAPIVSAYQRLAREAGRGLDNIRAVELGCGAANGTGYEWTARLGGTWTGVEPFARFDPELDARLREETAWRHPGAPPGEDTLHATSAAHAPDAACETATARRTGAAVRRVNDLDALDDASADVIVSNSVLEHVSDPAALFRQCARVLAPGGFMLHRVDYRDHFFKYPFHFLTFSREFWDNVLNPGDLPRLRLDDHLALLTRAGFAVSVVERETAPAQLAAVAPFLAPEFASRHRDMLATTIAALYCRKTP